MSKRFYIKLLFIFTILGTTLWFTLTTLKTINLAQTNALQTSNTFYSLQFDDPIYNLIELIFISISGSFIWIYMNNNSSKYLIIQRIGYINFLKKGILSSFSFAFILSLLLLTYQLILVSMFIHPLSMTPVTNNLSTGISPFDNGYFWSTIQFIIMAAVGWGVFALLVFAIALWVKKTVIAIILGGAVGAALIVVPALLAQILPRYLSIFCYAIQASTLISPGSLNYPVLPSHQATSYFPLSVFIYLFFSGILMFSWYKKRQQES